MDKVEITIITICFNDLHGLIKTANSIEDILTQRDQVEWVVVDGGSTDGSVEYIKKNHKNRFKWISESDNGIYHAMQKGINLSTGRIVNFLNSGDQAISKEYNRAIDAVLSESIQYNAIAFGSKFDTFTPRDVSCPLLLVMPNHQAIFFEKEFLLNQTFDYERLKYSCDLMHKVQATRGKGLKFEPNLKIVLCDSSGVSRKLRSMKDILYRTRERFIIGNSLYGPLFGIISSFLYFCHIPISEIKKLFQNE